jgi:hypothetical protein
MENPAKISKNKSPTPAITKEDYKINETKSPKAWEFEVLPKGESKYDSMFTASSCILLFTRDQLISIISI